MRDYLAATKGERQALALIGIVMKHSRVHAARSSFLGQQAKLSLHLIVVAIVTEEKRQGGSPLLARTGINSNDPRLVASQIVHCFKK